MALTSATDIRRMARSQGRSRPFSAAGGTSPVLQHGEFRKTPSLLAAPARPSPPWRRGPGGGGENALVFVLVEPDVNVGPNTAYAAKPGKPGSFEVSAIELAWMVTQVQKLTATSQTSYPPCPACRLRRQAGQATDPDAMLVWPNNLPHEPHDAVGVEVTQSNYSASDFRISDRQEIDAGHSASETVPRGARPSTSFPRGALL
jgi:hypothetical protein